MKSHHLAATLPILWLLNACDAFAPPPDRSAVLPPDPPFATTTVPFPPPVGSAPSSTTCAELDGDRDGFTIVVCPLGASVDPSNPAVDDCDDSDTTRHSAQQMFVDDDGDGFGSAMEAVWVCQGDALAGFVANNMDCADTDPNQQRPVIYDGDGDNFGAGNSICGLEGNGWVTQYGDCDDTDPTINPDVTEDQAYDGVDSNCDSYDVPRVDDARPEDVFTWKGDFVCPGSVLAVVGMGRNARSANGTFLHVANIGTEVVSNATLIVRKVTPMGFVGDTTRWPLPLLLPGAIEQTQPPGAGQYEVTFEFPPAADAGASAIVDAGPSTRADAGTSADSIGDASGTLSDAAPTDTTLTTTQRCLRAQQPFTFSSSTADPAL